ncbi:hypothetical protein GAYE_SCF26G4553 [Galdieria yellowstonensis]|uniref:Uncharacterized protein n=1 Tax=Galdieria yellowstonensis TaxID=3028027 RepID=A0AAV9IH12_9RHOD|nr:hypothetical protein GAYE_SCF26G4553 [Galdieria yellowstonensis]
MLRKETSPDWLQVETRLRFVDSRFNASLYVIDLSGDLNNYPYFRLSRASWTKLVQNRINYVAFFYREPPFLLGNSYFERALESLESCPIPGFGIALSTCGCIVPSSILESLKGSFEGLECLALPGFVVDREFVVWFDSDEEELNSRKPSKYCGNPRILNMRLFPAFDNLLREARGDFARLLEQKMSSVTGHL